MQAADAEKFWEVMSATTWMWVGLIVALLALAWFASRIRSWFHEDDDPAGATDRMLSEIREIYADGDLSEEEFRSIKGRLLQRREGAATEDDE
ncbi:MAG: hypothetical protein DWQ45_14785 [Planctomycetota bacterium]|nr:MAG: hypothetical protein DWQ29_01145 [Planctomycetota bacterium]REK22736.1 MAG: hypothetical protein DWQ41_18205 [Planctomycetota bacterium]REK33844.1 MAG: hypothetical protein DWQ45_14785 [Planctomycetota bacterium]